MNQLVQVQSQKKRNKIKKENEGKNKNKREQRTRSFLFKRIVRERWNKRHENKNLFFSKNFALPCVMWVVLLKENGKYEKNILIMKWKFSRRFFKRKISQFSYFWSASLFFFYISHMLYMKLEILKVVTKFFLSYEDHYHQTYILYMYVKK